MPTPIQISAASGLTIYLTIVNQSAQLFNTSSSGFETLNPANWTSYSLPATEIISGSSAYIGFVPIALPQGLYFLQPYNQSSSTPASTDAPLVTSGYSSRSGLILVLDWSGTAINSIAPLQASANVGAGLVAVPAIQNSLTTAQSMVNALYASRLLVASQPYGSVTVDGQQVQWSSPSQLDDAISFWERKVALLSGHRRRVTSLNLSRF